jgi:signal transduction histidine kinase
MRGESLERLFTDEDRAGGRLAREMSEALAHGRGGGDEGCRLRKDGSRFWAVGELSPIRDAAGAHIGFVKVLRDRTAQRRAEEALHEETRALEILNRTGLALSSRSDLHEVVQVATEAGVELTGAQFGAFFYNVMNEKGESYMLYTIAGVPREHFEHFPMPRNTEVFAPTFSGKGIVRSDDITRDPRYGRNAPYHGMPKGHLPVRSYLAVPVASRAGEVIGGLFFGHERVAVFAEREERLVQGLAGEAAVAIDNARLAASVQQELAVRRQAEEALRELNATLERQVEERTREVETQAAALRQAQKMEAVGQLTGGVAHDFNNLLQVIVGNIEIARRLLPPDTDRALRALNSAANGAKGAAALTQRLLAFARRQPLDPRPLNANVLVNGMTELLQRALGETISIQTVLGAGLWPIEADANQLENTILNLAVNARDAMPHGGRLTIETANAHIDDAYAAAHAEVTPGQYALISVSDTGEGMDRGTVDRAFEPFFTTKPVGKGTGLGLSQVYGFVKQSGGHVKIYSEVGIGTTVRIYLPRLKAAADAEPAAAPSPVPRGAGQEKILVVEDHEDVRAHSVEVLRDLGYLVFEAADGPAALDLLAAHGDFDLLFTDVVLPAGMTGAQVAAEAKARWPRLKILFTTGYARNAIVHHGRLDVGVHLLTKPFSHDALATKVRQVLDAA